MSCPTELSRVTVGAPRRQSLSRWLHLIGAAAVAAIVVWGVLLAGVELASRARPPLPVLFAAVALTAAGTLSGGFGWAHLIGGEHGRRLAAGFIASQLAKYVPGALWQPAGQVALARSAGLTAREAVNALFVFSGAFVAAASAAGPPLGLALDERPAAMRAALAALPLVAVALHPAVLRWALAHVPWNRGAPAPALPAGRRLAAALVGQGGYLLGQGIALIVVLHWLGARPDPVVAVAASALAWVAGFLAVPVPAGMGIREVALILLLAGSVGSTEVLTAAVVVRLATLLAEVLLAAAMTRLLLPPTRGRARALNARWMPDAPTGEEL